jgi:hypothetical protein
MCTFHDCDPAAYDEILEPVLPSLDAEIAAAILRARDNGSLNIAVSFYPEEVVRLRWHEGTEVVTLNLRATRTN